MTDHTTGPIDGDIESEAELETAMEQLLRAAAENGIDPRGTWVYRNGDSLPDWEVMILELSKEGNGEETASD